MGIAFCPLCSGPARFVGDREQNLELLPPTQRQKGRIVNVEIPYATKVLQQELESYTNIGMRFITTADTRALRQFEMSATGTEIIRELPGLILPEINAPELIEEKPGATVSVKDLERMGADMGALSRAYTRATVGATSDMDGVFDDGETMGPERAMTIGEFDPREEERRQIQEAIAQQNAMMARGLAQGEEDMGESFENTGAYGAPLGEANYSTMPQLENVGLGGNVIVNNMGPAPAPAPAMMAPGPAPAPDAMGEGAGAPAVQLRSAVPGGPSTIVVDTSREAMAEEGLNPLGQARVSGGAMGMGIQSRTLRMGGGMRMGGGGMRQPMQPQYQQAPPPSMGGGMRVTVKKLE